MGDPYSEMSLSALKKVELKLLERRANAMKQGKAARRLRQHAFYLNQDQRRELKEISQVLPHVMALIAMRESAEANLIPFPVTEKRDEAKKSTRSYKKRANLTH
jgi:hypothetical protein